MLSKNEIFSNENNVLSNRKYVYLDEDDLFSRICQIRETFSIPKLSKNKDLKTICCNTTKTGIMTPIKEAGTGYTLLSFFSIVDSFDNEDVDQVINRWFKDSNKRVVIISPGNYGAVHVEYNDETKTSGKIALIVALIYRTKNQK